MTPERLREVERLFHEARERTPAERHGFLARACAHDSALRREVESLLAQPPDGLLDAPVGAFVAELVMPRPPRLTPGSSLGPYRIERLLDAGAMGEVYRAHDTALGRDVAIKIIPRHLTADPGRLARFEREARVLASLNHPNIGAIYGLEDADGVRALVLELVDGETLEQKIYQPSGGLPVAEALSIARQIAEALDAAHEKGIVHRDLKPANIKVTPDGVVKVLDFGLAKAAAGELQTPDATVSGTQEGTILGTAAYMSPEQARGQPVDKRTDIWAFSCVLYEMLTGRLAFPGDTVSDTMVSILDREPDLAALPAATPPILARLLRRGLEKDPRRRLRDIADARADLDEALEGGTAAVAPPPVVAARPLWSWWPAVLLVALAMTLAGWWLTRPAPALENPLANAIFTRLTNVAGDEAEAALSPDGKFAAFLSDREGSLDVWLTQVGSGSFLNLTRESHMPGLRPVRNTGFSGDGSEIWFGGAPVGRMRIMPMMGGPSRPFLVDRAVEVVWSPDGSRIVYHTDAPGDPTFVADRTGAGAKQIFVDPIVGGHCHHHVWSPDGRWIYFARGLQDSRQMDLWRMTASGERLERLTYHNAYVGFPTPISDRTVVYIAQDHDGSGPWLWALDTNSRATRRVAYGIERYLSIAGSADHRRLVASVANPSASLWTVPILDRPAQDGDAQLMALPTVRALAPRFAGRSLFYLSSQGTGDGLWRFEDGKAVEILKGSDEALFEPPAVSADGRQVAVILRRDGKRRLHVLSADGGDLQSLAETIDIQKSACWSPDGKWIVAGGIDDRGPGLFKIPLDRGDPVRVIAGPASDPVWSPSGDLIVYTGANVSVDAPLLAIRPDGTRVDLPPIRLRVEGKRYRFVPDGLALVYAQGPFPAQDFWLLDLKTKRSRQLSRLTNNSAATQSFDVTPDGTRIVFDRVRENADIVLIDLAR